MPRLQQRPLLTTQTRVQRALTRRSHKWALLLKVWDLPNSLVDPTPSERNRFGLCKAKSELCLALHQASPFKSICVETGFRFSNSRKKLSINFSSLSCLETFLPVLSLPGEWITLYLEMACFQSITRMISWQESNKPSCRSRSRPSSRNTLKFIFNPEVAFVSNQAFTLGRLEFDSISQTKGLLISVIVKAKMMKRKYSSRAEVMVKTQKSTTLDAHF